MNNKLHFQMTKVRNLDNNFLEKPPTHWFDSNFIWLPFVSVSNKLNIHYKDLSDWIDNQSVLTKADFAVFSLFLCPQIKVKSNSHIIEALRFAFELSADDYKLWLTDNLLKRMQRELGIKLQSIELKIPSIYSQQ